MTFRVRTRTEASENQNGVILPCIQLAPCFVSQLKFAQRFIVVFQLKRFFLVFVRSIARHDLLISGFRSFRRMCATKFEAFHWKKEMRGCLRASDDATSCSRGRRKKKFRPERHRSMLCGEKNRFVLSLRCLLVLDEHQ